MCTQNVPLLRKDMNSKVQEVHEVLCSINKTTSTGRHTVVRMENTMKNILKAAGGKSDCL